MQKKNLIIAAALAIAVTVEAQAQSVTKYLLDTVDSGDGSWPCLIYELNYNDDIAQAEEAGWASLDEDESYWRESIGPFSIDSNKFFVTQWQSTVHPILIRRHFTLTAEDLDNIKSGKVALTYSYDENPKFWLNGTMIIQKTGWNDSNYASYSFTKSKRELLVEGDNVLAVSLQQGSGGGHIDYGLTLTYTQKEDGINDVETSTEENGDCYNLLGQKVNNSNTRHCIIIKNGKKTIR